MAKKLYGTDPDQVPTNADLGTIAYQDASRPNFDKLLVTGDTAIGADNSTNGNNAASRLDVRDTTDTYITVGNNTDNTSGLEAGIKFRPLNNLGNPAEIRAVSNFEPSTSSAYTVGLKLFTGNYNGSSFTSVEALGIAADGELRPHNNIKMNSGYGIDFSATGSGSGTMTSELLDDYEEGTFTPAFQNVATPTYTNQTGSYTKIGRLVHVYISISYSALNTGDLSSLSINLPFTATASGAFHIVESSTNTGYTGNNTISLIGSVGAGASNLTFGSTGDYDDGDYDSGNWAQSGVLRFAGVYAA